jgi:uncharacterized integral membrane protein
MVITPAATTTPAQPVPDGAGQARSNSLPTQAVYLALGVSLLLFLLLFVLIGINVVRRIQRRRVALDLPHAARHVPPADSAWATAGKRAKPFPEDSDRWNDDEEDLEDTAL